MAEKQDNTLCLCGEICEIMHSGNQVQIKILCKPEYLFFESSLNTDLHLGDKVFITVKYEAENILPFINQS
ncbi:MAG: hypothetical protein HC905_19140 [Bacteroidales bacterium]|nr:hypothetical protein [Bacteroidales bacterium]